MRYGVKVLELKDIYTLIYCYLAVPEIDFFPFKHELFPYRYKRYTMVIVE
jgi:hypothetical protein